MAPSPVQAGSLVGERLGKYDLLALLAIGGTAEIYLARIGGEAGFEKYVVVKCLLDHLADDAEFVRMFLDEARLGAQLDHSNIVQTLELGQHQSRYYMVMEHLAGMSLAQLARKTHERLDGGVIPVEIVIGLAAQTCAGLHYAHQRTTADGKQLNVVHRDVSPQNLVVTWEGVLKIVDFGIAKADQRQTHTRSGTIKGKFAYMSPEQCLAEPIDRRTDVFALGVVIHELLTARRLFKRTNTYETYQAILKGNVPPPSRYNADVDAELDQVVLKALAYHKEDRHDTAEALGEALLAWLHRRGTSVSASDVARYVERVCGPEIEEHAEHMRELIAGRQVTGTDHLRWDDGDRESSEESVSLGAAPLGTEALAATDFDDPGDTMVESNPAERLRAIAADEDFRVPGPGGSTSARNSPAGGGAGDFPPASLRPASGKGAGPVRTSFDSAERPTRSERGGGGRAAEDAAVAAASRPTVLEMQAPVISGGAAPGAPHGVLATPPPGPAPRTPPPAQAPRPRVEEPSISVYDTPPPVSAGSLRPPWADGAPAGHPPSERRPAPAPAQAPQPSGQPGGERVPAWVLALAFAVAAGVGLGITVLIGTLVT